MTIRIGVVVFDDAEELDFAGPWEVFTMASNLKPNAHEVMLVAESDKPVRCAKGMRVLPDVTFESCPKLDVVLIPGGQGTRREVENKPMLDWIARVAKDCQWVTSVCTGSLMLTAAGPARGKRVTTHWGFIETLRQRGEASEVSEVSELSEAADATPAGRLVAHWQKAHADALARYHRVLADQVAAGSADLAMLSVSLKALAEVGR